MKHDQMITLIGWSDEIIEMADILRREVFINEQNVPEDEVFDGRNNDAVHIVILNKGTVVATARMIEEPGAWHIGWVAVAQNHRGKQLGNHVMLAAIKYIASKDAHDIILTSQDSVCPFYEKLGFVPYGEKISFESGVVLVPMRLQLEPHI